MSPLWTDYPLTPTTHSSALSFLSPVCPSRLIPCYSICRAFVSAVVLVDLLLVFCCFRCPGPLQWSTALKTIFTHFSGSTSGCQCGSSDWLIKRADEGTIHPPPRAMGGRSRGAHAMQTGFANKDWFSSEPHSANSVIGEGLKSHTFLIQASSICIQPLVRSSCYCFAIFLHLNFIFLGSTDWEAVDALSTMNLRAPLVCHCGGICCIRTCAAYITCLHPYYGIYWDRNWSLRQFEVVGNSRLMQSLDYSHFSYQWPSPDTRSQRNCLEKIWEVWYNKKNAPTHHLFDSRTLFLQVSLWSELSESYKLMKSGLSSWDQFTYNKTLLSVSKHVYTIASSTTSLL